MGRHIMTRVLSLASLLAATIGLAHAAPVELGDSGLDQIVAADGNGNGNGNIGNDNGNNNQGNNNGNGNVGSGNGNGFASDNNGNGSNSTDVPDVKDALADLLCDIIVFDDGSSVKDARAEVRLRIYRARLAMLKAAEDEDAKVRQMKRKIERFSDRHPDAADAADRKRRNGISKGDLAFVFSVPEHPFDPKKGLQRIINRGYVLYGHDGSAFDGFADRLYSVVIR